MTDYLEIELFTTGRESNAIYRNVCQQLSDTLRLLHSEVFTFIIIDNYEHRG